MLPLPQIPVVLGPQLPLWVCCLIIYLPCLLQLLLPFYFRTQETCEHNLKPLLWYGDSLMEPYLKKKHKNYKVKTTVEILHINWFNIYLSLPKLETNLFHDLGPWGLLFLNIYFRKHIIADSFHAPFVIVGPRGTIEIRISRGPHEKTRYHGKFYFCIIETKHNGSKPTCHYLSQIKQRQNWITYES